MTTKSKQMANAPERVLIRRNSSAIARMTADLQRTCEILNRAIARLDAADLLPKGINPAIISGLIYGDATPIIESIESAMNETPGQTHAMRRAITQALETDKRIIAGILRDVNADFQRNVFYCPESAIADRTTLVEINNGAATFNAEAIADYYSDYATPEQIEYIAKARQIFDMLVEFERKTRIFSNGKAHGICDDAHTDNRPGVIEISNGRLYFDVAAVVNLDNFGADTGNKSTHTDNFTIVNPER